MKARTTTGTTEARVAWLKNHAMPVLATLAALALAACAGPPPAVPATSAVPVQPESPAVPAEVREGVFPTRVFTRDAIVTLHRPSIETRTADDVLMRTAVDVFLDVDRRSYAGEALVPANLVQGDGTATLLALRREGILFDFPGAAERSETLSAAAGFAFARQPTLWRFNGLPAGGELRRVTPVPDSRRLVVDRSDGARALAGAREREALRREQQERLYERLTTEPQVAPKPLTARDRYLQRTGRYGPRSRTTRGLGRSGMGRTGFGRR